MSQVNRPNRYESLDALRGLVALLVVAFHFPAVYWGSGLDFLRHSNTVTNLFFLISGFLLMAVYTPRLNSASSTWGFVKRRLVRLYPLHVLTLVLAVWVVPYLGWLSNQGLSWLIRGEGVGAYPGAVVDWVKIAGDLVMGQGFGFFPELQHNFPSWSMSVLFYVTVLFAVLTWVLHKVGNSGTRNVLRLVLAVALVGVGLYVLYKAPFHMNVSHDFGFFRVLTSFFIGVLAYEFKVRWLDVRIDVRWAPAMQAAMIAVVVAYFIQVAPFSLASLASPFIFAAVLLAFSYDHGDFAQVLKHPRLKWLSERSFGIFMTHFMWLFLGNQAMEWSRYLGLNEFWSYTIGTFSLLVAMGLTLWSSDLAYRHVEMRFATWLDKPRQPTKPGLNPA